MEPVDLADPGERRAWLELLRSEVLDLVAVGEDAARPVRERMFSRHEIGRRIAEFERVILARIDAAEATLRPRSVSTLPAPPPAPVPFQGDAEEQGPPSTLRPVLSGATLSLERAPGSPAPLVASAHVRSSIILLLCLSEHATLLP